jgi:alpha-tubulin suppressor-like RCC1 family protein
MNFDQYLGGSKILIFKMGKDFMCFVTDLKKLFCWGNNELIFLF